MIFVSYARKDRAFVQPLVRFLRASGQEVFVDQENLNFGMNWRQQVAEAIAESNRFLLFWSKRSSRSDFVKEEWQTALARRNAISIVPVMLDDTPLPAELSDFHGTDELQSLANKVGGLSRLTTILTVLASMLLVVVLAIPIYQLTMDSKADQSTGHDEIVLRGGEPAEEYLDQAGETFMGPAFVSATVVILLLAASYAVMLKFRRQLGWKLAIGQQSGNNDSFTQ